MKKQTNNELENREIGELISEITEKGFTGMSVELIEQRRGFIGLFSALALSYV